MFNFLLLPENFPDTDSTALLTTQNKVYIDD